MMIKAAVVVTVAVDVDVDVVLVEERAVVFSAALLQ